MPDIETVNETLMNLIYKEKESALQNIGKAVYLGVITPKEINDIVNEALVMREKNGLEKRL